MTMPKGQTRRLDQSKRLRLGEIDRALAEFQQKTPTKIGDGPAQFALTTTVDIQPFRWDANTFYRRLGLEPGSPRIDIVRAYHESPRTTTEEHLHFATAAKALLKKSQRRLYDALALGHLYGDDPALIEAVHDGGDSLESTTSQSWAVYADPGVSLAQVAAYDFAAARALFIKAMSSWANAQDEVPYIGLGITLGETRWEEVGNLPIFFMRVDFELTEDYASEIAHRLRTA